MGSISVPDFHIAIIGGGIGGLTTALSLAHHCSRISISVYEQAPVYREVGAGIGIGVNATRILHRIGVGPAVNDISGERDGIHRSNRRFDNGGEIVTIEAMDDTAYPAMRQLSVHRAEFLDVLLKAVHEMKIASLHTNKRAVRVEEANENEAIITFQDSTTATANLVISADGIHSAIRSSLGPNDSPHYAGQIAYRGLLPLSSVAPTWPFSSYAISWVGPNKHFLVFPISQNKTLNVVAFVCKAEQDLGDLTESWTSLVDKSELEAEFAGWHSTLLHLIGQMNQQVGKWKINDRDPLEKWVYLNGKVALLGDAAHAMLPHQGSGAGHAIEDGYVLSLALKDYLQARSQSEEATLSTWTQLYQDFRLPRAQRSQNTSRQAGETLKMQGPDFEGLSYEDCLPVLKRKLKGRMKWVWSADIDAEYHDAAEKAGLRR
ncbi:hypothetical protein N7510_011808 [Penicillium lagena]|uniref:uncharacterized protein n=1 Tax=Penicillium lagena TaxID=94218 RepID=UPI0025400F74|nr:uncharacterized protein N7510_011808 [Penicillium lagena]KAJ5602274.1 hypothetical protein N7510_011808 [Penicillium lagena]